MYKKHYFDITGKLFVNNHSLVMKQNVRIDISVKVHAISKLQQDNLIPLN